MARLCKNLFGPGKDKEFSFLFDYGQNIEFFNQKLPQTDGSVSDSLSTRLFKTRLKLIVSLDERLAEVGDWSVRRRFDSCTRKKPGIRRDRPRRSRCNRDTVPLASCRNESRQFHRSPETPLR